MNEERQYIGTYATTLKSLKGFVGRIFGFRAAVEGENVTYTLLRQFGDGEMRILAENLDTCEYTDTTAYSSFGAVKIIFYKKVLLQKELINRGPIILESLNSLHVKCTYLLGFF